MNAKYPLYIVCVRKTEIREIAEKETKDLSAFAYKISIIRLVALLVFLKVFCYYVAVLPTHDFGTCKIIDRNHPFWKLTFKGIIIIISKVENTDYNAGNN